MGFNFVCAVLPDNNTLLLGNQYMKDGSSEAGSSHDESRWAGSGPFQPTFLLTASANLSELSEYTMSPDGRVLLWSGLLREDSIGGRDLYVSFRKADARGRSPENMRVPASTAPKQDVTPFIAARRSDAVLFSNRPGRLLAATMCT
jgi:hypothetical protein